MESDSHRSNQMSCKILKQVVQGVMWCGMNMAYDDTTASHCRLVKCEPNLKAVHEVTCRKKEGQYNQQRWKTGNLILSPQQFMFWCLIQIFWKRYIQAGFTHYGKWFHVKQSMRRTAHAVFHFLLLWGKHTNVVQCDCVNRVLCINCMLTRHVDYTGT